MKTKLTLALAAFLTGTAFGSMPAVLPEFKNEKQLAEWRDEMAAKHATTSTSDVRSSALDVPSAFYTGKPYIEATGSYAFKYRSYNPELARWTSEDPSGFPDGANGHVYTSSPINTVDPTGLSNVYVDGTPQSGSSGANFSISTVGGPPHAVGGNGVAQGESVITFSVNSDMHGWIVQRVVFDNTGVVYTDGSQYASSAENAYWEAWRVDSIYTEQMGNISVIGNGNIDIFRTAPFSTLFTRGMASITGIIDFYQDSIFTDSNSPLNWKTDEVTIANGLRATYSEPSWWNGSGFNHQLTVTWE